MDFSGAPTRILTPAQARLAACILTIGAFDGVHRGHQALIRRTVAQAREQGLPAVVWTFDPPPKVFFGRAAPLCSLDEKLARIARLGADVIVVASFNRAYASGSAEHFLTQLARLNPDTIHVGTDFRFGTGQSGDTALLARHFPVRLAAPTLCAEGETVSSTRIRALRAAGDVARAEALEGPLGRGEALAARMLTLELRLTPDPEGSQP